MKWLPVVQGSDPWMQAHLGRPSASQFDRVLSPKKLLPSASQEKYLAELVAERILGYPVQPMGGTIEMQRGTDLEGGAVAYYEFVTGRKATKCGFALTDDEKVGASPDRLVGEVGLLEAKSPMAHTQIGYLLSGLDAEYRLQLQGQLYVSEREWVDFIAHCPGLPDFQQRFHREKEVLDKLVPALRDFCAAIDAAEERIRTMMGEAPERTILERQMSDSLRRSA